MLGWVGVKIGVKKPRISIAPPGASSPEEPAHCRGGVALRRELAELLWPNVSSLLHVPQIPSLARSGFGSWAFRRLTLVPSIIIAPGEKELPARSPWHLR